MSKTHKAFTPFLLLSLGLLGACSPSTPPARSSAALSAQSKTTTTTNLPKNYKYLHTLTITSSVTQANLQSMYGGYIVSYQPALGSAVVANNSSTKGTYDNATPEANTVKFKVSEQGVGVWATGFGTWSSGYGTWATGYGSWATGTTSAATTFTDNVPIWNAINLSQAQTLVPELGKGVKVAVIDTGIDLSHPAFQGKLDLAGAMDYLDGDSSPQEVNSATTGYSDGYGHGTAVADIVLQVAPNATILPIRVLDPSGGGDTATIASAISYAVSAGAKVINLSLGSSSDSSAVNSAIQNAVKQNVVVVAAAGNTGNTSVLYPAVNADTTTSQGLGSVGVGSINASYLKSSFSAYGSSLELEAPGENVMTAFPGGGVVKATGTSFSTPVVSGVLALAVSTGLTSGAVKTMMTNLNSTARAPSDPSLVASNLGYGSVDAYAFIHKYR
ncbi:peptidase S8 [Deinococcus irradiatisoli]|uniref:Peptidase S8 n=1 Tax=Deinococcus irradiatisoli TaxID=2202254 RepID=A0A2Z3JST3_9DEIO|nr:S8 family serine peptidase [Deinococcus irradiatisoli]AWN24298.1 peptidase S8 [Deinococcus irradiatisoli]